MRSEDRFLQVLREFVALSGGQGDAVDSGTEVSFEFDGMLAFIFMHPTEDMAVIDVEILALQDPGGNAVHRERMLMLPPITGTASGFITSAPGRVLHRIGTRLATVVATVMSLGRRRRRAPAMTASTSSAWLSSRPSAARAFATASSRYTTITTPVWIAMPNSAI
jgi:hypothetical protein